MSHNKLVIIDQMMSQLDAARPGIVPGSVVQAVVSGIQNTPSNIVQKGIKGNSGSAYTTFPISPIIKNCCLDKTYLNLEFDINFDFVYQVSNEITGDTTTLTIPMFLGFRDTANLFNQIQLLIENAGIWQTVYQREESTLAYCSLPETEIRGNNQYSSIEKMKSGARSPMKRILITHTGAISANTNTTFKACVHFKCTVDINRLSPIISNLHYTTPHFGNLRLKVYMQEIQKALFFCPDYGYFGKNIIKAGTPGSPTDDELNDVLFQPLQNQYWQFYPLNEFSEQVISAAKIPFYGYRKATNNAGFVLIKQVKFTNPTGSSSDEPYQGTDFFNFANSGIAEIVQTCFDIEEGEYQRLTDYFANIGSIIIPTQTWATQPFNNAAIPAGQTMTKSNVGNVAGYNINFVSVFSCPQSSPCCFCPEFYTNMQLLLEGRPINAIPYQFINDKAIVDSTQSIIDTDHEEINKDYMDSLNFLNETDEATYISASPSSLYGNGTIGNSINKSSLNNPNLYCINFSTNLPDAFHSGASTLEKATRNALLRLDTGSAADGGSFTSLNTFPYIINHRTTNTINMFSSLCDCCVVLDYDAARGTCFNGSMSWAAPYAD